MSSLSRLYVACIALGLALFVSPFQLQAKNTNRPALNALVIQLDNGHSYSLNKKEIKDKKGGAIFWGDWAIYNLLVPYHFFNRQPLGPDSMIRLWNLPGSNGQAPGFLLKTEKGAVNPLDPGGPVGWGGTWNPRPKVVSIQVGFEDGRNYFLTQEELYDEKSGVLFWGDEAVKNILVPFYYFTPNLPTSPSDVLNLWDANQPADNSTGTRSALAATVYRSETPAFLVKPRCVPSYPIH